jgi:hypothetical protein
MERTPEDTKETFLVGFQEPASLAELQLFAKTILPPMAKNPI